MSIETSQIRSFLDRYAAALTEFDAEAGANLWSTPGMIVDDRYSGVVASREDMIAGLERSYPLYQRLGLGSVTYELLDVTHLSAALVFARVRWHFLDAAGEEMTDSTRYYLLRAEEAGWCASVCVETDSAEKLQALAEDRGIDLAAPFEEPTHP